MHIDSSFASLGEAIIGTKAPLQIVRSLKLLPVRYVSFDGELHQGQLVIRADLAQEVADIFEELLSMRFPIAKVIPIAAYGWNDEASMADNNTSSFNYRCIIGTNRLSPHGEARAIDLNPVQNPCIVHGRIVQEPANGVYDPNMRGTFVPDGRAVRAFTRRGWTHGASWKSLKDYQHFEKL